jgi:energy-coupling factor transporter ATP-binding protein EcfA2
LSGADPTSVAEQLGVRDGIEADLRQHLARVASPPVPKQATVAEAEAEDEGEGILTLLQPPDVSGDRDTKAMVERYAVLRRPVPVSPIPDPDKLANALMAEFPWAPDVVELIRAELFLNRRLSGVTFRLPPILLVGEAGSGKSTFAKRLCVLAKVASSTIFAAGSMDNRTLAGTARGWSSATPSFPLTVMRRFLTANPIILVEEVDKSGGSDRNGRLTDTLAMMLDSSLSSAWFDECLQVAADISRVSWVLTANRLDLVPAAIRARCRIVNFPRPRAADFPVLLHGILRDLAEEYGVETTALPELPDDTVSALRLGFQAGRLQARQLSTLVRRLMSSQAMVERTWPRH